MNSNQTILIILGSGCSLKRYPLAKDMLPHLKEFGDALADDASRLRKLVAQTVNLFERLRAKGTAAQTLDDLARLVHNGHLADNSIGTNQLQNNRLVEDAKVAVAALFLSREAEAMKDGLAGYRSLMNRVFSSQFGTDSRTALKNTPYRVLTFNYDRLFELAFRQYFPYDGTEAFYGPTVLNSGLFHVLPQQVEVDLNRFSFLKLHGSVGLYSYEETGGCDHIHQVPDLVQQTPITDEEFFVPAGHGIHSNKPKPTLIVFPHEKDFLTDYPGNRFPFRFYIPEVWNAARHFAKQAKEIWLVGYSCPEPDFAAWSSLISSAETCEQVVVWNPSAEDISERLELRLPKQAKLFRGANRSFEHF
jgi:hypothetical protein